MSGNEETDEEEEEEEEEESTRTLRRSTSSKQLVNGNGNGSRVKASSRVKKSPVKTLNGGLKRKAKSNKKENTNGASNGNGHALQNGSNGNGQHRVQNGRLCSMPGYSMLSENEKKVTKSNKLHVLVERKKTLLVKRK